MKIIQNFIKRFRVLPTKDVHTEHCCITCGCKYMDEDCTVMDGSKKQSFKHSKMEW